jgi:hypothetical protein
LCCFRPVMGLTAVPRYYAGCLLGYRVLASAHMPRGHVNRRHRLCVVIPNCVACQLGSGFSLPAVNGSHMEGCPVCREYRHAVFRLLKPHYRNHLSGIGYPSVSALRGERRRSCQHGTGLLPPPCPHGDFATRLAATRGPCRPANIPCQTVNAFNS